MHIEADYDFSPNLKKANLKHNFSKKSIKLIDPNQIFIGNWQ
jgi:hypothetical protein